MAITWERLSGDTSKFAIKMSLMDDPDTGLGATADESSSWGSFQVWVKDRNLSSHQYSGELAESVHWYLLPLLEWWVDNWDPIFHEERLPNQNAAADAQAALYKTREAPRSLSEEEASIWDQVWYDWWARHCIEAARIGGLFPAICLRRWRDKLEISWGEFERRARPLALHFVHPFGSSRLTPSDVAVPVYSILRDLVSELRSRRPDSERIRALSTKLGELAVPREDRLAWLLGLGTNLAEMLEALSSVIQMGKQLSPRVREVIFGDSEQAALVMRPFPVALMFGAVPPRLSAQDRAALVTGLAEAYGGPRARVDELASDAPIDTEEPWNQGYRLAESMLDDLGVDGQSGERVDIEAILKALGVRMDEFRLQDQSIRAVAIAGVDYGARVLLNQSHGANRYPTGKRFSLAHELCHLLYDRGLARDVALPSGPWAPRDVERRANAFAAMILMPPDRIRRVLEPSGGQAGSRESVLLVCRKLETSFTATVEHMYNLALLTDEEREMLMDEAVDQTTRGRGM
jgi:Zn-dependent peptidase ImmA (M78 family)